MSDSLPSKDEIFKAELRNGSLPHLGFDDLSFDIIKHPT